MQKKITRWKELPEEFLFNTLLNGAEQERYRHYRLVYGRGITFLKAKMDRKKIWLDKLEVPITTCCTLCCRHCANLMQYYENPSHVSVEQIKENLSAVLTAIDGVRFLRILGGEPLLHPDLYEILNFCIKECDAVQEIIIITNGTLLFQNDVIELMKKHPEFLIQISNYGSNSSKLQLLVKQLNDAGIRNEVSRPEWKAKADLHYRKRAKCSNTRLFRQCSRYVSLLNDELHVCPRSCHGTNLRAIPKEAEDYVWIARYKDNKAALKAAVIRMLEQPYVEACKYCGGDGKAADRLETVTAGEQCSRREARTYFREMAKGNSDV